MPPIVIIGAGLAAWTTARELRRAEAAQGLPSTPVLLVTADSGDFYAKPALSNAFAQGRSPAQLVSTPAAKMAQDLKVQLMVHTQVERIDTTAQQLHTSRGPLAYRQLVLATGAQPIKVPIAGNGAPEVLSINSLDDFAVFHARLQAITDKKTAYNPIDSGTSSYEKQSGYETKPRILIMGAGLIGCEFANDLAAAHYPVQVVDPAARPLAALLPEAASLQLRTALSELGVQWHWGTTVQAVEVQEQMEGQGQGLGSGHGGYRIDLANGTSTTADMVLSAVGLRADLRLAQAAGLRTDRGICVDQHVQTSASGVYALGDAAQYLSAASHVLPQHQAPGATLPYVMPIMAAAKVLALNLLAPASASLVFSSMPVAIKTPALPLVVAPPQPGQAGAWHAANGATAPLAWEWQDAQGALKGFALAGSATAQRARWAKALAA
jgi:rubredoxin---NAD+ reductase